MTTETKPEFWEMTRRGVSASVDIPVPEITASILRTHEQRTPRAQAMDEARPHSRVVRPSSPYAERWPSNKGRLDIVGVDFPKGKKPASIYEGLAQVSEKPASITRSKSGISRSRPRITPRRPRIR